MSDVTAGPFRFVFASGADLDPPRPNSLRRAHASSRQAVAAAASVLQQAGLAVSDRIGVYVGQQHLPADYSKAFIDTARNEGPRFASPVHFSESVANNVASHLSMTLRLSGIIETYVGTRTAGLNALEAAMQDLGSGAVDGALVVVLSWAHDITRDAYRAVWNPGGRPGIADMELHNGALSFVLRRGGGKGTLIRHLATRCGGVGLPASVEALRELWRKEWTGDRVLLSCLGLERPAALESVASALPGVTVRPSPVEGRGEAFALDPFLQLWHAPDEGSDGRDRVILVAGEDGVAGVLRVGPRAPIHPV